MPHGRAYPDLATYLRVTGRTLESVADEAGISIAYVSRIRRGQRVPSLPVARRLAEVCNIPIESLDVGRVTDDAA